MINRKTVFLFLYLGFILLSTNIAWANDLLILSDFRREAQNQSVLVTHPFYPDSVWNSWINQGQMDLASYGIIEKLDTLIIISGTTIYSLNSDFIQWIDHIALKPTGKRGYDFIKARTIGGIPGATGLSTAEYCWTLGEGSTAKVGFYPTPTTGDTLLLIYGAEATYLDSDTATTDIPYSYRTLIIDYVVYRALLRENKRMWRDYYENYKNNLALKLQADQKQYDILVMPQQISK